MRAVFFLLLFANLAYLAWAEWIDVPQPPAANAVIAKLPRLKLVGENSSDNPKQPSSGRARKTALQQPPRPTAQCLSVGPFYDEPAAARAASLLRDKGLAPRQRSEQGEIPKGYWVYIGGLKTDRDVSQVLRVLEQSHVEDARPMPDTGDDHRVSVGLFTDRDRADRRAQSLQKLGLQPEVAERKVPGQVFWMDVALPPGTSAPTAPDFATVSADTTTATAPPPSSASQAAASHPAVTPCPAGISQPGPLPTAPGTTTPFRTKVAGASQVP